MHSQFRRAFAERAIVRMSDPDQTDGNEKGQALLIAAERRFEALVDLLPPELCEEISQGKISRHEASTFVLDRLLIDEGIWQDAEKLLTKPTPKRRPKLNGKAENVRNLVAAFDGYAAAQAHDKSISSLIRGFRKTLGPNFGWLRGMSHERVGQLIREGRRLLVPDVEQLANARRASLSINFEPLPQEPVGEKGLSSEEMGASADDLDEPSLTSTDHIALNLTSKEASFLRLIRRGK
jgi:hypothetical protein